MNKSNSRVIIQSEKKPALALIPAVKLPKAIISLKEKEDIAKAAAHLLNIGTNTFVPVKLDGLLPNQESGFVWGVDKYDKWILHFVKTSTKDGIVTQECYLKMANNVSTVEIDVNQKLANACNGEFYQKKHYPLSVEYFV